MQECPACHFNTLHDERVIDEDGVDRGSRTKCSKCGHVTREDID